MRKYVLGGLVVAALVVSAKVASAQPDCWSTKGIICGGASVCCLEEPGINCVYCPG